MTICSKSDTGVPNDLYERHGPIIGGAALAKALGYASTAAFRQAFRRHTVPIEVFEVPNRKGKFALTKDVNAWLENLKQNNPLKDR